MTCLIQLDDKLRSNKTEEHVGKHYENIRQCLPNYAVTSLSLERNSWYLKKNISEKNIFSFQKDIFQNIYCVLTRFPKAIYRIYGCYKLYNKHFYSCVNKFIHARIIK